jgi:hypothetical protein
MLFDGKKVDANTVQHLITKTTKRTMIVLDYGISPNEHECEPPVAAFKVKSDGSNLLFNKFQNPLIRKLVNDTVRIWAAQNSQYGWTFPSQTDLRKPPHAQQTPKVSSPIVTGPH